MIEILSLGAGVQSTTVFLMSCLGELPKLDHAIFADTQWEPEEVYSHLATLKEAGSDKDINVSVVSRGDLRAEQIGATVRGIKSKGERFASLPLRTRNTITGEEGMIRRQCTREYKIDPIDKEIRRILGLRPRQRFPKEKTVRQWFGISYDEPTRMRSTDDAWRDFYYPLVEKRMTRQDCIEWNKDHGFPEPPRSACLGCPFHSNAEWRAIKSNPKYWKDVVEFDEAIRPGNGMWSELFLHRSYRPLKDVDLRTMEDAGQLNLWENECEGMCGV